MTITEANAVNVVLKEVMEEHSWVAAHQDPEKVKEACMVLAAKAHKILGAGLRPEDIEKDWVA